MRRFRIAGVLVIGLIGLVSPTAVAAAEREQLRIDVAVARPCDSALLPSGTPGVVSRTWSAPAGGYFEARLVGSPFGGDWDLAVFRLPGGNEIATSTSIGAAEFATTWVDHGEHLAIQACRRDGRERSVPLEVDFRPLDRPQPSGQRVSLESVWLTSPGDVQRLQAMGFDVTEDVSPTEATLVLYSNGERAKLREAGFSTRTIVADLSAKRRAERAAYAHAAAAPGRSALPSGRDTYRVYADYTNEMQALVDDNPGLVRGVALGTTIEGRTIEGVEIATDVDASEDGRPVYVNMGEHHAREWPSSELPMEFAIDLVDSFNANDSRIVSLLENVRVIVIPVVNVDGFIASRETAAGENKRKNCRANIPAEAALPCELRATSGVDLNRNYGAYWGGVGSSNTVSSDIYRGPAPYSEPESEAVHQFTAQLQDTVMITNHTFTNEGEWLRQPGFNDVVSVTPDETAMKSLGDAMAAATGWQSNIAYAIGEITGATEDWNYFAQGTYGYTPEVRGDEFHDPDYADMVVEEYLGDTNHAGLGVREAYLLAGERAANPADHGIIQGTVPVGATLRLHKEFDTPTSQAGLFVHDVLDTTLDAPASGQYLWHVNPSARPLVPGETWTMSCELPGQPTGSAQVPVARGQVVQVNWDSACQTTFTADGGGGGGGTGTTATPPKCKSRTATVAGTAAADVLAGTNGRDVIAALGGNDTVNARGSNDLVCAGGGKDKVKGGGGRDKLLGQGGKDTLRGGPGKDTLKGGAKRDKLIGGPGNDVLKGGGGTDVLVGGPGTDTAKQ